MGVRKHMKGPAGRREFLFTLARAAAGLTLSACTGSGAARADDVSVSATPLADDLTLFTGAGGNVVVLSSSEGLLMIDGGSMEASARLLRAVRDHFDGAPIRILFNTHWHYDHTGSNEALGKAGIRIVAHENTKLWLGNDFWVEWEDRHYRPRPAHALPNDTFRVSDPLGMSFGGRQIVYQHLPRAHTDGDIYVFFPDRNVLVAGDLVSVGRYPVLDFTTGGWIGGLADATKALIERSDSETRIVPGTGPVQTRDDLQAQFEMLSTLKDRLAGLLKKGMNADDMIAAAPTREFDAKWGDPTQFIRNAYRGLWAHARTLGGIV